LLVYDEDKIRGVQHFEPIGRDVKALKYARTTISTCFVLLGRLLSQPGQQFSLDIGREKRSKELLVNGFGDRNCPEADASRENSVLIGEEWVFAYADDR
jgi:hypothetical protein